MRSEADALLEALDIRADTHDLKTAAAFRALAEEVLFLREEERSLRHALATAEEQADSDVLCPVFNRRAFLRELAREMALSRRHGTELCLLYIDLDRFKLVNDRFGHARGDDILQRVSAIIGVNVRETDIVGRLGGDEFAVILSHAGLEDAAQKAVTLEERIARITIRPSDKTDEAEPIQLGASCGVAEWDGISAPDLLISQADEAMFRAKARRLRAGE